MSKIMYKYHRQIDNPLHKAAFRGKVDKIKSLLNDYSPYKATSESQTPLHLSIAKGHLDAANIFLSILEIDLIAAKRFLSDRKVDVRLGNENFACAIGRRQIEMVKQKCSEMIVKDGEASVFDNCTFVLMKENVFSVPDVLAIRPNNQQQKFVLLSTVFQLLNENGVISLNVQKSSDRSTVLHCAAAGGYIEVVMRLLDLGANPHLKDIAHQTAIGAAHSMGEFHTYVEMCRRLRLDMFATKDFVKLPVNNAIWENVQFLIETLVALRMGNFQEDHNKAIRTVLLMREIAGTFLLSNIGEKCLETYGEHLSEKNVAKIFMLLLNHSPALRSDIIMRHILQDCSIVKAKTGRVIHCRAYNTVLHILVRNGRSDIVRKIYEDFPHLKTILFEHKELGLNALTQCIQSNHIELAQFLIEEHENEINRPDQWSQLLITAAELPASTDFMKMILEHRMTDPNLVLRGVPSVQRNALFVCIAKGNLEKIKVILDSNKMTDLNRIQSEYETLLQSAICSMNAAEVPLGGYCDDNRCIDQFKYLTNDLSTSEDEDEPLEYHPTEPLDDNATKYEIMNNIFDLLIAKGANVKHIDASHKTLLHHAVAKSNRYVVERLLCLGLDPIDPDRDGNLPLHYVRNSEIFDILRNHPTFEETLTARNKGGATFLHNYARCLSCSVDFISKLIDCGVDVNAVDNSGNTPLHYMVRPPLNVCEFLINNNANINLKNSQGLTATHTAISQENFGLAALLIKQPTFNLFTLTNTGKSYLTLLTRIHGDKFNEIKIALETRKDELIQLIAMYCNEVDDYGFSNLLHATDNKYLLDLLIAQPHIQVNAATCTQNYSLLHKVRNDVKFARFLVDKGLDVNGIDPFHRTPLIQALTADHGANIEVIKYLIEAGANVNCFTERDISPLRVACENFHLESIRILLEAGADSNVKGSDGKLPFECLPIEYRSIVSNIVVDSS